jgi:hypothetical protein
MTIINAALVVKDLIMNFGTHEIEPETLVLVLHAIYASYMYTYNTARL